MKVRISSTTLRRKRRGATSTEYVLILAAIILPLGALTPMLIGMIVRYTQRIEWVIRLPFG